MALPERIAIDPKILTGKPVVRRPRSELQLSLDNPHPDTGALAELGLAEWAQSLPDDNPESLLNPSAARNIRWTPGEGWTPEPYPAL
jgi:hypothetical protein